MEKRGTIDIRFSSIAIHKVSHVVEESMKMVDVVMVVINKMVLGVVMVIIICL